MGGFDVFDGGLKGGGGGGGTKGVLDGEFLLLLLKVRQSIAGLVEG